MTLDKMIELARDHANRVMVGSKAELTPAWLLITAKGDIEIFNTPWENTRQKYLIIETMRNVMREKHCTAHSIVTEAWSLHVTGDAAQGEYKGPMPSESPDRQECVVVMAANKDEYRYQTLETVRAANGTCAELRQLSGIEDRFTGLFDNLLDDKRRAH
jgi:hypothetical protein